MAKKSSDRVRKRSRKSYRRNKHRLRSPPPPLHSSKLWIWALIIFISTQQVVSAGLLRQEFNGSSQTGGESRMTAARFRRETIKLDNAIHNLGHLARIANGIALEIGLVDGTIDPGEAVTELLHMGSLTVDDVTNLHKDTIDGVLSSLGDRKSTNQEVLKLENRLANLEKMRAIAHNFRDNFPGLKEYQDSLGKLKQLLSDLQPDFVGLQDIFETLAQRFRLKVKNSDEFVLVMSLISSYLTKLKSSLTSFDSIVNRVAEAKKILEKSSFIDTLLEENDLRSKIDRRVDYDADMKPLLDNFEKVIKDSGIASTASKSFETLQTLVQTRGPYHRQSYKHCFGFPSGADDLDELYVSSADPFFVKHISNGETVSKNLRNLFEPFKMLEKPLDDVTKTWEPLKKPELNNVFAEVVKFAVLFVKSKSALEIAPLLRQCDTGVRNMPITEKTATNLVNTTEAMKLLSKKVHEMSDFAYVKQFSSIDTFLVYFDTDGKTKEEQKKLAESTLKKLKTDKNLKAFVSNINRFEGDIVSFLDLAKDPTQGIDMSHVSTHLAKLKDKDYQTFLSCLQAIKTTGSPVQNLIDYLKDSKKSAVSPGAKSVITNVIDSGKTLQNAQNAAADFKNNKDLPLQLATLKSSFDKDGYKDISEKLGKGVQGLMTIRRVRDVKLDAQKVIDILKDAKASGLSKEHQTSLKQLEEIPKVLTSIDNFIKSSQGLQVFRRKRDTGFQDFHQIFMDAQAVQGATIDMKSLREAMEELNKKTSQKHATSMSQLKNLGASDLDFVRFSFKDVPTSLTALDNFFIKYATQSSPSPPANGSPGQKTPQVATSDRFVEATTASGGTDIPWGIILPAAGVIGLIGIAFFIWWKFYRKPEDPIDVSPLPSPESNSHEKEDGKAKQEEEEKKKNGGKKDNGPKPPPPPPPGGDNPPQPPPPTDQGGTNPPQPPPPTDQGGTNPPQPPPPTDQGGTNPPQPPPPTDQGGTNPPQPTDQGNVTNQGATAPPPTGAANDQAGAPTKKQAAAVLPPVPGPSEQQPLTDDQALLMTKRCTEALRLQAAAGNSPRDWAKSIYETNHGENMVQLEDLEGEKERRHIGYYCLRSTMAVITGFINDFINCNMFVFALDKIWLAAQGPMDGTEGPGKKDTREKHQAVIHQNDVGLVLQLCQNMEEEVVDGKKVLKQKSARYYSETVGETVTNGNYELKTIKRIDEPKQFVNKKDFTLFKCISKDKRNGETKPLDILLYKGWPDFGAPATTDPALDMLRFAEKYNNVLVHCSAGIGRTGTIIAIKLGIEMCQNQKVTNPDEIIAEVRKTRYGSIQDPTQVTYLVYCITKGVMNARKIRFHEDFYKMEYYHRMCLRNKYGYLATKEFAKDIEKRRRDLLDDRDNMEDYVEAKKANYEKKNGKIQSKKPATTNPGKNPEAVSDGKKDGDKQPTTSEAKVDVNNDPVGEIKDSNASEKTAISEASQKTAVLGASQEKSKKSEKNSKTSAATGGSQKKSRKSQKNSKVSAAPSGSQEKSKKKKSSKGGEKKSKEKKQSKGTSADPKKKKRSKHTKKGGAKAK